MTTRTISSLGLAGILMALIIRAERHPDGAVQSQPLKGGLTVEVRLLDQPPYAVFTLRISRGSPAAPGLVEWRTCIQHLPTAYQPAEKIEPGESAADGRNYLSATWPIGQKKLL